MEPEREKGFFKDIKEKVLEVCMEYGKAYSERCIEVIDAISSVQLREKFRLRRREE